MATPYYSIKCPKGLKAGNATKVSDEDIASTLPDWAIEAMKEGKQITRRDGEFYVVEHETEEDKERFSKSLNDAIDKAPEIKKGPSITVHLPDGSTHHEIGDFLKPIYDAKARHELMERTKDAIQRHRLTLKWTDTPECDTETFGNQERKYMMEAIDAELYGALPIYKRRKDLSGDCLARKTIWNLTMEWLEEQAISGFKGFGKYGGDWNCGDQSGVWADFLLKIKARDDFKGYCPHKAYFVGVRLAVNANKSLLDKANPNWKPTMTITQTNFFYEPEEFGLTTQMFPNFGKPFTSKIEKQLLAEWREADAKAKKEAKRVEHEEWLQKQREEAEERRKAREMEETIDETILAYNAQVKRTKDLITFNRTHIAEPLRKRIEAREEEIARLDAERRHAEKLKQKEMERLAKHAPSFKTKSK